MQRTKLLVCDLDNTLYDWVGYFVPSFNAMVDAAVRIMDCDRNALLDDLRAVHQEHNDSEHPFALLETATVRRHFPDAPVRDVAAALDEAFHAFNSTRKRTLRLNPGVAETIETLRTSGILLVAHTESKLYSAYGRLARLGLLDSFHRVYCRERSNSPHPSPTVRTHNQ